MRDGFRGLQDTQGRCVMAVGALAGCCGGVAAVSAAAGDICGHVRVKVRVFAILANLQH